VNHNKLNYAQYEERKATERRFTEERSEEAETGGISNTFD